MERLWMPRQGKFVFLWFSSNDGRKLQKQQHREVFLLSSLQSFSYSPQAAFGRQLGGGGSTIKCQVWIFAQISWTERIRPFVRVTIFQICCLCAIFSTFFYSPQWCEVSQFASRPMVIPAATFWCCSLSPAACWFKRTAITLSTPPAKCHRAAQHFQTLWNILAGSNHHCPLK